MSPSLRKIYTIIIIIIIKSSGFHFTQVDSND